MLLVIDNYDSFTYNLVQYLGELGVEMKVFRNDEITLDQIRALKPDSLLWISFPKGTSKIQTHLTRDKDWDALRQTDLKWITLISVNETWSAFALRPYKPGEERQTFR